MPCTEAYKEHIMYTFNGYCKTVIRFAAINAWRNRSRRRQKEISLEYLTEEKFYPLGTTDECFEAPYEEYPITICGQTVILTNGELAAALLSLPEKNREIIFLYFFGHYTQREIGEMYGRCRSTTGYQIRRTLQLLHKEMEAYFPEGKTIFGRDRHPKECDCQRKQREEREAADREQKHREEVERLKRIGFTDPAMREWTFGNDNGKCPQMGYAREYVECWELMKAENHGLILWGSVGTGKSYFAGCIANALMEREVSVCMTNFAAILNDLAASFKDRNEYISRLCSFPLLIARAEAVRPAPIREQMDKAGKEAAQKNAARSAPAKGKEGRDGR